LNAPLPPVAAHVLLVFWGMQSRVTSLKKDWVVMDH